MNYRTGETARVGDIFGIAMPHTNNNQRWRITAIHGDRYSYIALGSVNNPQSGDLGFSNQNLAEVSTFYLIEAGERSKSGFGKFIVSIETREAELIQKIEAKPEVKKKKDLPF